MCLITKKTKPDVSDGSVRCLKVLLRNGEKCRTPYMRMDVSCAVASLGMIRARTYGVPRVYGMPSSLGGEEAFVDKGFVHSFLATGAGVYGVCRILDEWARDIEKYGWELCVFECRVPRGVEIYDDGTAAASRTLKVERDVTDVLKGITVTLTETLPPMDDPDEEGHVESIVFQNRHSPTAWAEAGRLYSEMTEKRDFNGCV